MNKQHICSLILAALLMLTACGRSSVMTEISIIPEPVFVVKKARSFTLTNSTRYCFVDLGQNTPTVKAILKSLRKLRIRPTLSGKPKESDCIVFQLNAEANPELGEEGYLLEVRPEGITISANSEAGLYYGYQSFLQLLPSDIAKVTYKKITLPECTILDYPRFGWRGCLLDVSRHFFTVKEIKKHIDLMAFHKLNVLVLHLNDDHGFRIESDLFPQLNDIGSWRADCGEVPWDSVVPATPNDEPSYGGYYSHEDITEIVEYAAQRHIQVVPDIEIPGHATALLAAYPHLSCRPESHTLTAGNVESTTLCAGNDEVLQMLTQLFDEILPLFPSPIVQLGGHCVARESYEACPKCQQRMRQNQLHTPEQLQYWLLSQIADHLSHSGRRVILYDDMMDFLSDTSSAILLAWHGGNSSLEALSHANQVIMMPNSYCRFDLYQTDSRYQPTAAQGMLPLSKVYRFDPSPKGSDNESHILGAQCCLWTEYIDNYSKAEFQLLPRLCALSECLWTPSVRKDWHRFQEKIDIHKDRLESKGFHYCQGNFAPVADFIRIKPNDKNLRVTLTNEVAHTYIYYTTDGSTPTLESALYTEPLYLPEGTHLKTLVCYRGQPQDGIYEVECKL